MSYIGDYPYSETPYIPNAFTFVIIISAVSLIIYFVTKNKSSCKGDEQQETVEEMGRCTWTLLHRMCARFPTNPSEKEKRDMLHFIETLGSFYPCMKCADHMQGYIKDNPPKVNSRKDLQQWFCDLHNSVNKKLNKSMYNCERISSQKEEGCTAEMCSIKR